ncbi:hypothetical protein G6F22_001907 [Rhizopus arrhizus]|nr:hypothetical protein G6F22_001907 [Rhizopus arrhizus]KAG1131671.1 hypothetical protein G6F42_003042 [Rhizopus arrhizus]
MDQNTVYQLFLATYHPSPEVHKQAEINIRNIESLEGFLPIVLYIQASQDLDLGARQAAAIYFKNRVCSDWEDETISNQDKQTIKDNILQALINAPNAVQIHLTASLHKILCIDFPDQWSDFMQSLEKYLVSDQVQAIQVGLIGLYELVKVFQWKSAENREPLYKIVALAFPVLQTICQKLFESGASELLELCFKIYHSSIQMELPPCFEDQMTFLVPWCSLFVKVIERPMAALPENDTGFEKYGWQGTKEWAYTCLNLLLEKYTMQSPNVTKSFMVNFASNILTTYLHQLDRWMKKECYLSDKCLASSADFLNECVKHKATWKIMKDYVNVLIAQFIFPLVCFSDKDEQCWTENAIEYIHKKSGKEVFETGRDKDGALYMVGALAPVILESKRVLPMMEPFFVNHVLPEFKSKFPFLRARACELVRYFSDLEFSDEQNLNNLYLHILDCLNDDEIPVRFQAILALQHMIRYTTVRDATVPHLSFVMQTLLNLMNQVDMDVLVTALEEFVEIFSQQLSPFAVELCKQLSDTYLHLLEEVITHQEPENPSAGSEEIFNNKIVTAMSVTETIQQLVLKSTEDVLSQIEMTVIPIIQRTIENKAYALYNEIFELVAFCVLSSKHVSQSMWSIFELCYRAFKEDGEGLKYYANQMVPSLYSFITFGKDVFIKNDQVKHMVFDIVEVCMGSEELKENDRIPACRLLESVLLNCRDQMDQYVSSFLNLAFRYILAGNIQSIDFKVHCLEIVVNCIYYNPLLTLGFLEENHWTQGFFSLWFSTLSDLSSLHDKTLTIVALCSLLRLPTNQIPASLQATWPQILNGLSLMFKELPEAPEEDSETEIADEGDEESTNDENDETVSEEEDENDEDEEESDEDDTEEHEPDDDVEDEDAEYLEYLAHEAAHDEKEQEKREIELLEESLYHSHLDELDPYDHFEQSLKELQHYNPQFYEYLMKSLSQEEQGKIVEILSVAEQSRTGNQGGI